MSWFIKRPGKDRRSYSLASLKERPTTDMLEKISALNKQWLAGAVDSVYVEAQLSSLIKSLRLASMPDKPQVLSENINLFNKFWKERFAWRTYVDEQSRRSVHNDYRRAVEALGTKSILTITGSDVEQMLARYDWKKQRRLVARLTTVFKFFNRQVNLRQAGKRKVVVTHLTETELEKVIEKMSEPYKLLYRTTFYTGCRMGELVMLDSGKIVLTLKGQKQLRVDLQCAESGAIRAPKGRNARVVYVPKAGEAYIEEWCRLSFEEKKRIVRGKRHASVLRVACDREFPGRRDKHCTLHDLRHSTAIYLLSHGLPEGLVARSIGDDLETFIEYYSGFILTDSGLVAMDAMWR